MCARVCGARRKKHAVGLRRKEGAHQDTINPPGLHTDGDCTQQLVPVLPLTQRWKFGDMKWKRPCFMCLFLLNYYTEEEEGSVSHVIQNKHCSCKC